MADWNETDLLALIASGAQEHALLEFKACASLDNTEPNKTEISKDISAFANSGGGDLIYGVIETQHVASAIDAGFDPAVGKALWLEQVINSRVQPRIRGLRIVSVLLEATNPGRVALVVIIPPGHTAHQASDKRFYRRHNFEVLAMDAWEVRDVMNRSQTPLLVPVFSFHRLPESTGEVHKYSLVIRLTNQGAKAARDIQLRFTIPDKVIGALENVKATLRWHGPQNARYQVQEITVVNEGALVFPGDEIQIGDWGCSVQYKVDQARYEFLQDRQPRLEWVLFAYDMPKQQGSVAFAELYDY